MRPVRLLAGVAGLLTATTLGAGSLDAQPRMLIREPSHYLNYGYGYSDWTDFTSYFDAAFAGAGNIVRTDRLVDGALSGYSALMLTLPDLPDDSFLLDPTERAEITDFLTAGGRLYVFGENDSWRDWNASIASLVGATVGGSFSGSTAARFSTGILEGVSQVSYPAGGAFVSLGSGVSLFESNVAALFGPTNNALFILDVNLCDDGSIGMLDNRRFCQNITNYLAGTIDPPTTVPEPATVALVGAGLVGVLAAGRRRRSA